MTAASRVVACAYFRPAPSNLGAISPAATLRRAHGGFGMAGGGGHSANGTSGGAGGYYLGTPGVDGTQDRTGYGSGGGGGGSGAAGGSGGAGTGQTARHGGAAGTASSVDGGAGANGRTAGGGGGGGGYAGNAMGASGLANTGRLVGGAGGNGGSSTRSGGGGGGTGGIGAIVLGSTKSTNTGTIIGGDGGNGGNGAARAGTYTGGQGGVGGAGVYFESTGAIFTNSGTVQGGAGGIGGQGQTGQRAPGGYGGAAIVGGNLTVVNTGTLIGGSFGYGEGGLPIRVAIIFRPGHNNLTVTSTSNIVGVVLGQGDDTLGLAGTSNGGLDLSSLGSTNDVFSGTGVQYGGFSTLKKAGSSTWTLSGSAAQDISLSYVVTAGTLDLGGTTQSAASLLVTGGKLSDGELDTSTFMLQAGTVSAVLGGFGAVVKTTSGTAVLSGANTYTGGTTIAAGTLKVASDANLGDASGGLTFTGGKLETTARGFASARGVTLDGNGAITVDKGTSTFSGILADGADAAGRLLKGGAGRLVLSGANTYSGGTAIYAGTISIRDTSGGNYSELGSGAVTLTGGGLELASDGVAFANEIDVAAGKTGTIGVAAGISGFLNQSGSSPLNLRAKSTLILGSATDTGTIDFQTYPTDKNGVDATATVLIGGGTVDDLYGYLGDNYLSVVAMTGMAADTTLNLDDNSIEIRNLQSTAASATIDTGTSSSTVLTVDAGSFAGTITGGGGVDFHGDTTLSGVSTNSGSTTIDSGATLTLAPGGATSATSAIVDDGTVQLAGGTLAGVSLKQDSGASGLVIGFGTISADIAGSGLAFTSAGGALTFTGTNTLTGTLSGTEADFTAGSDAFSTGATAITVSTFDIDGAAVSFGANVTYRGAFELESGSLDVGAANLNTYKTLDLAGGTITGTSGHVASYGTATLEGRTTTAGGVTLIAGGLLTATGNLTLSDDSDLLITTKGTYNLAGNGYIGARTSGDTITNQGLLEKTVGTGTSLVTAAITNTGTIDAAHGTLDLTGAISGTGSLSITGNSALELGAMISAQQSLQFGTGNGRLKLDDAADFHATISGFNNGDYVLLKAFSDASELTYKGGVLTVTDGAQQFSTQLSGSYQANKFSLMHSSAGEVVKYTG